MSNVLNYLQKKRQGVGASILVLFIYIHPAKLTSERYPYKEEHDDLSGLIINQGEVKRGTIRDQLYIFIKYEDIK